MPILRRRLICHYCGQRHHQQLPHDGRRFKCTYCEAVNFLDENGDIADVPPDEAAATPRYAHHVEPNLTTIPMSIDSIFCDTCLKNQYLFNEALANYLPEASDPQYAQFVAAEPLYRRQLQDRYPQCCAQCAPRVEERLRHSTYAAKSDHVRRLLENSRRAKKASRYGWRSVAVSVAGCTYMSSILIQLMWHFMGAIAMDDSDGSALGSGNLARPKPQHVLHVVLARLSNWTQPALLFGLLSIWWNPKWHHKISGNLGRLRGLSNYYQAQILLLAIRFASWNVLAATSFQQLEYFRKPAHSMCLVVEAMILAWSLGFAIKVDMTSNVNWQQELTPLLSKHQFVPPTRGYEQSSMPPDSQRHPAKLTQFPLANLGPQSSTKRSWQPPTPPDDDDPDRMEVDYQPAAFQPKLKPLPKAPGRSPFHGTLSALPQNRLLGTKGQASAPPRKAIGLPPGFFDKPRVPAHQAQLQQRAAFAIPKLQTNETRRDTGLENIFGAVFSLKDEPVDVQDVEMRDRQYLSEAQPRSSILLRATSPDDTRAPVNMVSLTAVVALLCSITSISITDGTTYDIRRLESVLLAITNAVLFVEIILSAFRRQLLSFQCICFTITSSVLAILTAYTLSTNSRMGYKAAASVMGLLVWPEICSAFWSEQAEATDGRDSAHQTAPSAAGLHELLEPQNESEPRPSAAWTDVTSDFGFALNQSSSRPRASSVDSDISSISAATTSSTASGWKTPKASYDSRMYRVPSTPGVVSGMGRLGFDDRLSGNSIAGPRARRARKCFGQE